MSIYVDSTKFDIDKTGDDRYVVLMNTSGEVDGWNDLTEPFDTYEEAEKWASKIKDTYGVYKNIPF